MANHQGVSEALKVEKATQNKIFGETALCILNIRTNSDCFVKTL